MPVRPQEPESPTPLAARLARRIEATGPLSFADFMEAALYDPDLGYYTSGQAALGTGDADFRTSPEVHPLFGWMLARQVAQMHELLGRPSPFRVVELGPGSGRLAAALLAAAGSLLPGEAGAWEYVLVERSPALRRAQRRQLGGLDPALRERVRWAAVEELAERPAPGVVLSNEFFDALPVHRVRGKAGGLEEARVGWTETGGFGWVFVPPGPPIEAYFRTYGAGLADGQGAEAGLEVVRWVDRVAACIERGYLLTIDYGDWAEGLYGPARPDGTLLAYRGHRVVESPFRDVGLQDLTAHVNFTAVARRGEEHGFRAAPLRTQTEFLLGLGVLDRLEEMDREATDEVGRWRDRLAAKDLFVPGGMGETFRVLMQARQAPVDPLLGLGRPWRSA